ncbi:MAG: hypothetical protein JWL72_4259 [Ilumatobacteraceae bacterium]|nr:hypothetical protein [Ilumatobacteraceae bacterium]MCU1390921.1 hypothetical protein [Ilumatobacteraceae bacterium]
MISARNKKRLGAGLIAVTALGAAFATSSNGPAHADPKQPSALVGVGSDTIQDVMNAFAGTTNGAYFTPLHSTVANGSVQEVSFDAIPPAGTASMCINTKNNGPLFTRPNGSGAGVKALSDAFNGVGWTGASYTDSNNVVHSCASTLVQLSGQIDFARSSSGPGADTANHGLTYVPIARDAVSFAFYRPDGGTTVDTLSAAQLHALYTSAGTAPVDLGVGVNFIPCAVNSGSGTWKFFLGAGQANFTDTQGSTAGSLCGGRLEENDGTALKARADGLTSFANVEFVVPFSAASFTAKSNGVALGAPPLSVKLGAINGDNNAGGGANLGFPVSGTAPNVVPNGSFYDAATFGRNVYVVLPTSVANPTNVNLSKAPREIFVNDATLNGNTAVICQSAAQTIAHTFGFTSISTAGECGSKAHTADWVTGP